MIAGGLPRFEKMVDALALACAGKGDQTISYHLRVLSHPELLTWKEYRRWYRIYKRKRTDIRAIRKFADSRLPIEKRREFLRALIRERESELSLEANDTLQFQREQRISRATEITEDSLWFANLIPLFKGETPIFDISVIQEWMQNLSKWAHFNNDFYRPLRESEQVLAVKLAEQSVDQASTMLESIRLRDEDPVSADDMAFQATGYKIREIWKKALADQLADRFLRKDGIRELWGKERALAEKRLLFQPNPYFHTEVIYLKLGIVAQKAVEASDVQENFVEFMRMLMYAALDITGDFDHEKALEILKTDDFREMIWAAATCRRIHRRSMGSMLQRRKTFIQKTGKRDAFPIPSWVEEMEPDLLDTFREDSSIPEASTDQPA